MARGRRKVKKNNPLLDALKFIQLAQKTNGSIEQTHCRMQNYTLSASNSIVSAGCQIAEDIQACPHTSMFADALDKADSPSISLLTEPSTRLSVRSGEFLALIPCLEPDKLPVVYPDAPIALASEALKAALSIAGILVLDGAEKIVNASVRLLDGSVLSTDGNVIIEVWHGISMPYMILPKTFITALQKTSKTINKIGGSENTFTIWFEDGSWLKSSLYPSNTELPKVEDFLNVQTAKFVPTPKSFFETVKRLEPFSTDGMIYLTEDGMRVISETAYAIEQIVGIPKGIAFKIKSLLQIADYAKQIHFNAKHGITLFNNGENVRGAIINQVNI